MLALYRSSHVFNSYPWLMQDLNNEPCGHARIVQGLQYELTKNETRSNDPSRRYIQEQLGLIPTSSTTGTGVSRDYVFAMFMLRYRLLDISLWVSRGCWAAQTNIPRSEFPNTKTLSGFGQLQNWPGVLSRALEGIKKAKSEKGLSEPGEYPRSPRLKHLQAYLSRKRNQEHENILLNIDLAAMYLSHLFEGHPDLDNDNAPQALLDELERDPNLKLILLKNPLHIALAVSPICLFLPTNLSSVTYGRGKMLDLWKALGSHRPQRIRLAEQEIWSTLFSISCSIVDTQTSIITALQRVANTIFSTDLGQLTDEERWFFKDTVPKEKQAPLRPVTVPHAAHDLGKPKHPREEEEEEEEDDNEEKEKEVQVVANGEDDEQQLPACGSIVQLSIGKDSAEPIQVDGQSFRDEELEGYAFTGGKAIEPAPAGGLLVPEPIQVDEQSAQDEGLEGHMSTGGEAIEPASAGGILIHEPIQVDEQSAQDEEHEGHTSTGGEAIEPASAGGILAPEPIQVDEQSVQDEELEGHTSTGGEAIEPASAGGILVPELLLVDTNAAVKGSLKQSLKANADIPPERKSDRIAQSKKPLPASVYHAPPKKKQKTTKKKAISRSERAPIIIDLTTDDLANDLPHPELTLKIVETAQRFVAEEPMLLYDAQGATHQYTPSFHFSENLKWFMDVKCGIEQFYVNAQPRHIARPKDSMFEVLDYKEFMRLKPSEVQAKFALRHLVLTGYPLDEGMFDEDAMDLIASDSKPITIHDLSICPKTGVADGQHTIGLTRDLLDSHRSPHGKILNALDFPMPMPDWQPPHSIASHRRAWHVTVDDPQCKRTDLYPTSDLHWALAATRHAFHYTHIDTDGFGTFVLPQSGLKYWIVGCPKAGDGMAFAATNLYIDSTFAIDKINTDLWDVEGILLTPGTCLFMRPNTPHLVITPESSICYGGHFYSSSTIRDSCHGLLHTFVASSLLTNTEHTTASRDLLRRMLTYYCKIFTSDYISSAGVGIGGTGKSMSEKYAGHIPNIFDFDGLIDVLSLCNLAELANVLHYKTYTSVGLTGAERKKMIHGRQMARRIRLWLESVIEIQSPNDEHGLLSLDNDIFYPYLASQVSALCGYKRRAPTSGAQGNAPFTLKDLECQINGAFEGDAQFARCCHQQEDPLSFDWTGPTYTIRPARMGAYQMSQEEHEETFGQTPDDRVWLARRKKFLAKQASEMSVESEALLPKKRPHDLE